MVGMLLYRRADANETDEDGWIALRQLVKYGAIVNAKSNYGETALHQAASKGHELPQQAQIIESISGHTYIRKRI